MPANDRRGDAVPDGASHRLLDDLVSREDHAEFLHSLADDPDLATT